MPHDHSEDDGDNEPIVESTPPRVLGLAAHMKAQSEGESSQPQGFFIMPQQDGLKSSVMPIGAHADGSGHIHGPNCGCGDHGDAQKTNPPHGQPGHVCGAEGKANDHQPKQKRQMRATVYAASGIGYLARKISGDRIGKNFKDWTSRNNANVVLPVAGLFTLASIINKDPTLAAIGTLTAPVVMNDAVDNFMRAARSLEDKHQIPRQTTAALATFSHAGSEIASAGINTFKGLTDESVNAATKLGINLTSTIPSSGPIFFVPIRPFARVKKDLATPSWPRTWLFFVLFKSFAILTGLRKRTARQRVRRS